MFMMKLSPAEREEAVVFRDPKQSHRSGGRKCPDRGNNRISIVSTSPVGTQDNFAIDP